MHGVGLELAVAGQVFAWAALDSAKVSASLGVL